MSDEKKSIEQQLADVKPLISSKEEQLKVTMRYVGFFIIMGVLNFHAIEFFLYGNVV